MYGFTIGGEGKFADYVWGERLVNQQSLAKLEDVGWHIVRSFGTSSINVVNLNGKLIIQISTSYNIISKYL